MAVISGIVGAISGKKGADAQADAARDAAGVQREIFEQTREDFGPYRDAGYNALAALQYELGLAGRPMMGGVLSPEQTNRLAINTITGPTQIEYQNTVRGVGRDPIESREPVVIPGRLSYSVNGQTFDTMDAAQSYVDAEKAKITAGATPYRGFTKTPGYDFRMREGMNAIQASAAARGGLNSGATMKALGRFGQDYAASEYGTYLNRLGAMAGVGQTATGTVANAGQNYAAGAGNALMAAGQARASGYNAIGQGVQNTLGGVGQIAGFGYGQGWFG